MIHDTIGRRKSRTNIHTFRQLIVACSHQEGETASADVAYAASAAEDDSVFLAGSTVGQWTGQTSAGNEDFAVAKFDADGEFLWAWQVNA